MEWGEGIEMRIAALAFVGLAGLTAVHARAENITPDFSNVPSGWYTDRYTPSSFSSSGAVLSIGINAADHQTSSFYNTQGEGHDISGGAGDYLIADLYVPTSWASGPGRRTDMWGVMTDGDSTITDYPIIGFTNEGDGGFVGFRVWNENIGDLNNDDWFDLTSTAVDYGGWNSLSIAFDGTDIDYYVNGVDVYNYEAAASDGTEAFKEIIMQAYNFGDSSYTATYEVPEPMTLALFAGGLGGLAVLRRRRRA